MYIITHSIIQDYIMCAYRIRKKIRGEFNFVIFVDNKDPQIFSLKRQ